MHASVRGWILARPSETMQTTTFCQPLSSHVLDLDLVPLAPGDVKRGGGGGERARGEGREGRTERGPTEVVDVLEHAAERAQEQLVVLVVLSVGRCAVVKTGVSARFEGEEQTARERANGRRDGGGGRTIVRTMNSSVLRVSG